MTIKYKLFLPYAIVSLVIFSLSFALFFFQVKKSLTHQIREELAQFNQMITDMVETAETISVKNQLRKIAEKNREVSVPLFEMQKCFWLILIVSLLILGVVTLGVSASITKPLNVLIHRFEKGARGDWSFRMDDTRGDEIGKLSTSFNLFMTQLDTFQKELTAENRVRKETETALRNLENYLSNIINSMPSLLIGVDNQMKVTQWNRQAEITTGISMADAHNRFLPEVFPRIRPHLQKVQESLKEKEIQYIVKSPFLTQDAKTHYEDMTLYPLTANGGEGAVIRIDDVSKNVWMEEAIIQNEKMRSMGGLAAGMAHEINNPLAGIIQNAALLSNRLTSKTIPANVKAAEEAGTTMASIQNFMAARNIFSMIEAITGSAMRMASIVENMLSFSRKSDDSFSENNLTALMDKTLKLAETDFNLKKHFDFKSIAIEKQYEKGLPMVACDGGKLQQVLLNILNNGAQAMCEKELPGNRKPRFILRLCKGILPNRVDVEIQDNGPGMDEETRKKIFEPFFTTKPSGMGTGLGLSVSYFIITKHHGGTMDVISQPGKGTTFIIGLPCCR
ncbi:MAG: HAMP domain-containing protein [Proteobacteria bacterium]|nr:HAMP domain-containing protein [Pseudomonadota bacterium]